MIGEVYLGISAAMLKPSFLQLIAHHTIPQEENFVGPTRIDKYAVLLYPTELAGIIRGWLSPPTGNDSGAPIGLLCRQYSNLDNSCRAYTSML